MSDLERPSINKRLTSQNWLEPDPVTCSLAIRDSEGIRPLRPQDWADKVFSSEYDLPQTPQIPDAVYELYASALACMAYGGFWHPFSGVGVDLLLRAMDTTVKAKAERVGIKTKTLHSRIKQLREGNFITHEQYRQLEQIRQLRNSRIHTEQQAYIGLAALDYFASCKRIICDLLISSDARITRAKDEKASRTSTSME